MYADNVTGSMRRAIDETYRRRRIQMRYNEEHHITPVGISKTIRDISSRLRAVAETTEAYDSAPAAVRSRADMPKEEIARLIKDLESQMKQAAKDLEFERAALLRDQIVELRGIQVL